MKLLIVGRTGTGKDTLQSFLQKYYGWKSVLSYSTRARRPGEGDTHIFITKEEAAAIPMSDKVAVTYIKNDTNDVTEYFATRQQVEACDCYIIDPNGVKTLLKNMPDEIFEICYIKTENKEKQKEMAILRANGDTKAGEIFETRYNSEDKQFSEFESLIPEWDNHPNCALFTFTNTYDEDALRQFAFQLNARKHTYEQLQYVITDLKNTKVFEMDEKNRIQVYLTPTDEHPTGYQKPFDDHQFAQLLLADQAGFFTCLQAWLGAPTTELHSFTVPKTEKELTLKEKVKDIVTELTKENPDTNTEILTEDICTELESLNEFHEMIDNYLTNMVLSRINK